MERNEVFCNLKGIQTIPHKCRFFILQIDFTSLCICTNECTASYDKPVAIASYEYVNSHEHDVARRHVAGDVS